jgi:hypothetical protein
MVPEANKFVFAVPPEQTKDLPKFDRQAAITALNPAAPASTSAELQLSEAFTKVLPPANVLPPPVPKILSPNGIRVTTDIDAQTLLNTYASVTGRQAHPLPSTSVRFSLQPRRAQPRPMLDQAEVIYVLQALAFVNGLVLENVGANECRLVQRSQ